jgi:hypothetical protein
LHGEETAANEGIYLINYINDDARDGATKVAAKQRRKRSKNPFNYVHFFYTCCDITFPYRNCDKHSCLFKGQSLERIISE